MAKYSTIIRVPKLMISDQNHLTRLVYNITNLVKRRQLKRSIRLMNIKFFVTDSHDDCFIRNELAILLKGDGYKIPRIIKDLLMKKSR